MPHADSAFAGTGGDGVIWTLTAHEKQNKLFTRLLQSPLLAHPAAAHI